MESADRIWKDRAPFDFNLGAPEVPVDRCSAETFGLLFCNAAYVPASALNHWMPVLFREQIGKVAFEQSLQDERRRKVAQKTEMERLATVLTGSSGAIDPSFIAVQLQSLEDKLTECPDST